MRQYSICGLCTINLSCEDMTLGKTQMLIEIIQNKITDENKLPSFYIKVLYPVLESLILFLLSINLSPHSDDVAK